MVTNKAVLILSKLTAIVRLKSSSNLIIPEELQLVISKCCSFVKDMLDQLKKTHIDEIIYYNNIREHLDQIESICSPFPEFQQTILRSINTLQLYLLNKLFEFPVFGLLKSVLKAYILEREIQELKGKETNGEMNSEQVYNSLMELIQKNDK